jgi:hypothetical protein
VEFSKDCSVCIATNICAEDNFYKGAACKKFHELVEKNFTPTNKQSTPCKHCSGARSMFGFGCFCPWCGRKIE